MDPWCVNSGLLDNRLAIGDFRGTTMLRDAGKGKRLTEMQGYSADLKGVSFSPDGNMIAACSGSCYENDISVGLCDVGTGKEPKQFLGHSN